MTHAEAILILLREAQSERRTKSGYFRAVKAVNVLPISSDDATRILYALDYVDSKGMPWTWLTKKKAV